MAKKLKLTDSIYILEDSDSTYDIIFTSTRRIKSFKVDNLVRKIIEELKEDKSHWEVKETLKDDWNNESIERCLDALEKQGIVREYDQKDVSQRYSRQVSFIDELTSSWKETISIQKKLEGSTISVFGVGGIGTWIVNGLYQIGIGEIRITYPDVVEESNLNRQLFFDSADLGEYKVDVIKSKLRDARIIPFRKSVSPEESLEDLIRGSDFLINCADQPSVSETSQIIDDYSRKYDTPYCVAGGYNMHLGMVGPLIIPGRSATFNDFLEYQKSNDRLSRLNKIKDVAQTGNIGPIAGAIANIQVMEIFKYLTGKGELNIDKFAEIDFMNLGIEWKHFGKTK